MDEPERVYCRILGPNGEQAGAAALTAARAWELVDRGYRVERWFPPMEVKPRTCTCTHSRGADDGFTSPAPGYWVHAKCGLPAPDYLAAQVTA